MQENQLFERSPVNLNVMLGLGLLAHGVNVEDMLETYDGLTHEDIQACLIFTGQSLENSSFMHVTTEIS